MAKWQDVYTKVKITKQKNQKMLLKNTHRFIINRLTHIRIKELRVFLLPRNPKGATCQCGYSLSNRIGSIRSSL